MNDQFRGFILSALATLAGWSGITSIGLLIEVANLQATTGSLEKLIKLNSEMGKRTEDKLLEEITLLRTELERQYDRR